MECSDIIKMKKPSYLNFDGENYYWKNYIDYRKFPSLYKIGKGEQGVLICQPYKDEICKYWKFKTPEIAESSSEKIYELFLDYLEQDDFVGADLARKYLQMGFTRARRYANYKGGRKYDSQNDYQQYERGTGDEDKAISADIFFKKWKQAEDILKYKEWKKEWKKTNG